MEEKPYTFRQVNIPYLQDCLLRIGKKLNGSLTFSFHVSGGNIAKMFVYNSDDKPFYTLTPYIDNALSMGLSMAIDRTVVILNFGVVNCSVIIAGGVPQNWKISTIESIKLKQPEPEEKKP